MPIMEPDVLQPAGIAAHMGHSPPVGGCRVPIMEPDVLQPAGVAAAVLQLQSQAAAVADLGNSVLWIDRNDIQRIRIADPTVLSQSLLRIYFQH